MTKVFKSLILTAVISTTVLANTDISDNITVINKNSTKPVMVEMGTQTDPQVKKGWIRWGAETVVDTALSFVVPTIISNNAHLAGRFVFENVAPYFVEAPKTFSQVLAFIQLREAVGNVTQKTVPTVNCFVGKTMPTAAELIVDVVEFSTITTPVFAVKSGWSITKWCAKKVSGLFSNTLAAA